MPRPVVAQHVFLMSVAGLLVGQARLERAQSNQVDPRVGLTLVRYVNTVQTERRNAGQVYADLQAILKHPELQSVADASAMLDSGAIAYRGYRLALVVGNAGSSYLVQATPLATCEAGWFGDQRGLIFRGRGLGCSDRR